MSIDKITIKWKGKRLFDVNELASHPLRVKIVELQDHLEGLGHERPTLSDIVRRAVFQYHSRVIVTQKQGE